MASGGHGRSHVDSWLSSHGEERVDMTASEAICFNTARDTFRASDLVAAGTSAEAARGVASCSFDDVDDCAERASIGAEGGSPTWSRSDSGDLQYYEDSHDRADISWRSLGGDADFVGRRPGSPSMDRLDDIAIPSHPYRELEIFESVCREEPTEGSYWYIVCHDWLARWLAFAKADGAEPPPGPIDNSVLLCPTGLASSLVVLEEGLVEDRDYNVVPTAGWRHLVAWHSGGPAIQRPVLLSPDMTTLRVELYPLAVLLWHVSTQGYALGRAEHEMFPRGSTADQLRRRFARRFYVPTSNTPEGVAAYNAAIGQMRVYVVYGQLHDPPYALLCGDRVPTPEEVTRWQYAVVEEQGANVEAEGSAAHVPAFVLASADLDAGPERAYSEDDDPLPRSPSPRTYNPYASHAGLPSDDSSCDDVMVLKGPSLPSAKTLPPFRYTSGRLDGALASSSNSSSSDSNSLCGLARLTNEFAGISMSPEPTVSAGESRYTWSTFGNVEEPGGGIPGLCGLRNLGNTCFMNSALQCLSNTALLSSYFLSGDFRGHVNRSNPLGMKGEVAEAYGALLEELWSGRYRSVSPVSFKRVIGTFAPQFSGYSQHDSQEFLGFLLDGLHEDLNRVCDKPFVEKFEGDGVDDAVASAESWRRHLLRNQSTVVDLFQGQFKSTVVCADCGKVSITFDPFMYLSLPLPLPTDRTLTVVFFARDPASAPLKLKVTLKKDGSVDDLCAAVARVVGEGVCADSLVVADVLGNFVFRFLARTVPIRTIADQDDIFVYEIVPLPPAPPAPAAASPDCKEGEKAAPSVPSCAVCVASPIGGTLFRHESCGGVFCESCIYEYFRVKKVELIKRQRREAAALEAMASGAPFDAETWVDADFDEASVSIDKDDSGPCPMCSSLMTSETVTNVSVDGEEVALPKASPSRDEDGALRGTGRSFISVLCRECPDEATASSTYGYPSRMRDLIFGLPLLLSWCDASEPASWDDIHAIADAVLEPRVAGHTTPDDSAAGSIAEAVPAASSPPASLDGLQRPAADGARGGELDRQQSVAKSDKSTVADSVHGSDEESDVGYASQCGDEGFAEVQPSAGQPATQTQSTTDTAGEEGAARSSTSPMPSVAAPEGARTRSLSSVCAPSPQRPYRLLVCNMSGTTCVRCSARNCTGCPLPRGEERAVLRASEAIVVEWVDLSRCDRQRSMYIALHPTAAPPADGAAKPSGLTLRDCLSAFAKEELLENDDQWYCPQCKEFRRATKRIGLWRLPQTLVVHLKRFMYTGSWRDKIDAPVRFPLEGLDLRDHLLSGGDGGDYVYDCYAIVNHYGGLGGGHYTAHARLGGVGQWINFDDTCASPASPDDSSFKDAYVLFYVRRGSFASVGDLGDFARRSMPSTATAEDLPSLLPSGPSRELEPETSVERGVL